MFRFGVGQNLYIYKQSIRLADIDWERAVTDWYDEVTLFSKNKVTHYLHSLVCFSFLKFR